MFTYNTKGNWLTRKFHRFFYHHERHLHVTSCHTSRKTRKELKVFSTSNVGGFQVRKSITMFPNLEERLIIFCYHFFLLSLFLIVLNFCHQKKYRPFYLVLLYFLPYALNGSGGFQTIIITIEYPLFGYPSSIMSFFD